MPGWTPVDTYLAQGRTFQRPLDPMEYCSYLWGDLSGTADILHHYEIRLSNGSQDAYLFSETNVIEAWMFTKRRYPLVVVTIRGADCAPLPPKDSGAEIGARLASEPYFVVREHDLTVLRPNEIVFGSVSSVGEARQQTTAIMHGPRLLSDDLSVQIHVLRETDAERTSVLHLMILLAHHVTDGTGNRSFVRSFLDTLSRGLGPMPVQIPLEERLEMAIPPMDLEPPYLRSLTPAIRRWRRAAGAVISQMRTAKIQGGHTLPWRLTRSSAFAVPRPGRVSTLLTPMQTTAVIANCRLHGITFGNAYLPLAQVAMTRVLYRRYLRGEISEEEWAYRKRQPYINRGPLNLRPYLDQSWFEKGGGGEFMMCISLYIFQLPFMTLGGTVERRQHVLSDGAPRFSDLLTFDRFLHRARLVKKQSTAFFSHPLFLEIVHASHLAYLREAQLQALRWIQRAKTANGDEALGDSGEDKVLSVTDLPKVVAHGGSSLGNLDLIFPTEYPLPPSHSLSPYSPVSSPAKAGYVIPPVPPLSDFEADTTPKIVVENSKVHFQMLPGQLYLGAATSRGRMEMFVYYDGNVYEEAVVQEWLDELREAAVWYLGGTP